MEEEAPWPNGAMDPYWGSLHCVRTLIVPFLTQMYKWVLVTEQEREGGEQGAAEVTSIGVLIPNALERSKTPLKGL